MPSVNYLFLYIIYLSVVGVLIMNLLVAIVLEQY